MAAVAEKSSNKSVVTDMVTVDPRGRAAVYSGETIYEGNTTVLEGSGVLTVTEEGPNKGNTYTGKLKAGKFHGEGTWKSGGEGNSYSGSWKNGEFHGEGTYTWTDGSKYVGSFAGDKFHGRGVKYDVSGKVEEQGLWWNDEFLSDMAPAATPVVDMETVDHRGRAAKYTGDSVDGLPDGNGEMIVTEAGANCGNTYKGQFKRGKMHGEGTWTSAGAGSRYAGSFVDGNFHGQGAFTWADGAKYEGEFMDDMFHGRGTKKNPDGSVEYSGLFWCDEPQNEDD